jgi:hypothetical protein
MKKVLIGVLVTIVILEGFFIFNSFIYKQKQVSIPGAYTTTEYLIEGEKITLGESTHYFGNEFVTDLNEDGRDDSVFLITHELGGSGTFFMWSLH